MKEFTMSCDDIRRVVCKRTILDEVLRAIHSGVERRFAVKRIVDDIGYMTLNERRYFNVMWRKYAALHHAASK